jgi:hypothetical protein
MIGGNMDNPAPKRIPAQEQDTRRRDDKSGKQVDRDADQGISRDQRGQDQPKDKDRAQS